MAGDDRSFPIRIGGRSFDPLGAAEKDQARRVRQTGEKGERVVVQLHRPPTREDRARLKAEHGLRLNDYVPEQAYTEIIQFAALDRLLADPAVRAVVPYEPDFKVAPNIGERAFRTDARRRVAGLWLEAVLFPDGDFEAVTSVLQELGATDIVVLDDRKIDGPVRIRFIIESGDALPVIATVEDIRSIDEVGASEVCLT